MALSRVGAAQGRVPLGSNQYAADPYDQRKQPLYCDFLGSSGLGGVMGWPDARVLGGVMRPPATVPIL
jgi:hypothetical protein